MLLKWTRTVAAVLAIAACAGTAQATTVYSDTVLVRAPEFASVIELPTSATPGSYRITATDLNWLGAPLQALSFGVFTATAPVKSKVGAGTLEFFYAGADKLFLQLYAKTAPSKSAGLVGLQADYVAAVPLPASLWLLLSALGATGAWRSLRARAAGIFRRASLATAM
jgi:hypothetical protein